MFKGLLPAFLLGLLVYGEARGEPLEGQVGVACVVRTRALREKDKSFHATMLKPYQFSCFNQGDRNRALLEECAIRPPESQPIFRQCLWVGQGVYENYLLDPTGGADHYLTTALLDDERQRPSWANPAAVTKRIGHHAFLRLR